jgi:Holliday junction DNA helicase RuvA
MIASVRGRLLAVEAERAVVEVGGLGVELLAATRTLSWLSGQRGQEVTLQTCLLVRADALQLFGFRDLQERAFFLWLITVSGVGPKVALAVLSGYPVEELRLAVARDDVKKFESIPGIGKRIAQRIVIELKDKVGQLPGPDGAGAAGVPAQGAAYLEARSALQNFGLTLREAEDALRGAPEDATLEELVRFGLGRARSEA